MDHVRLLPPVPVPGGNEALALAVQGVDADVDLVLVDAVRLLLGLVEHEVAIPVELLLDLHDDSMINYKTPNKFYSKKKITYAQVFMVKQFNINNNF